MGCPLGNLVGRTPIGRVTIYVLAMKASLRVALRKELIAKDYFQQQLDELVCHTASEMNQLFRVRGLKSTFFWNKACLRFDMLAAEIELHSD